jgi:hypothetical protein
MIERRYWTSQHGIRACWAHGMRRQDVYLLDERTVIGRRNLTVHVVDDLPNQLVMPLTFAGYEAIWHSGTEGECLGCRRIEQQDRTREALDRLAADSADLDLPH